MLNEYFLKKLLLSFHEAKETKKAHPEDSPAIMIRIINPEEEVKNTSSLMITITISVVSSPGNLQLNDYYNKRIIIPPTKKSTEAILIPFIESILEEKRIAKIANFMNSAPYMESLDKLFFLANIYCTDNTIFTLPKNDFRYLDLLKRYNQEAVLPNDDYIAQLILLKEQEEKKEKPTNKKYHQ